MEQPVRCYGCGKVMHYSKYKEALDQNATIPEALAACNLKRYCCKRMVLTQTDIITDWTYLLPLQGEEKKSLPEVTVKIPNAKKKKMPLKVTQTLIDQGYNLLTATTEGKTVSVANMAIVIASTVDVVNGLLTDTKKHVYTVELTTAILRKLIETQVAEPKERALLMEAMESTVLFICEKPSCKCM